MGLSKLFFSKKEDNTKKPISQSNSVSNKYEFVIDDESSFFKLYSLTNKADKFIKMNLLSSDEESEFINEELSKVNINNIKNYFELISNERISQIIEYNSSKKRDIDEEVFVYMSEDKMLAWIILFPAIGEGEDLTGSQLLQALINKGVTFGINYDELYKIPKYDQKCFKLYLIAQGRPPIDGKDGSIVELYTRDINLSQGDLSHVDYAKISLSNKIKEGGVICEIIPPTPAVDGITVTRDLLLPPPKNGQPAYVPKGRNTMLSEDGRYLIAKKSGYIGYSGKNFQVKPVLEIFNGVKEHDEKNINFLGDVHIHGDVVEGTTIRALGDIQVDGLVEGCTIEAGENIIVMGGIQGHNLGTIRAHKSIYAKYIENCEVYAQENIKADCIIDCNIYSNGTVSAETGTGAIIRGVVRSSKGVYAKVIGSKSEVETDIILGGLPCDEAEQKIIAKELNNINREIENISNMKKSVENELKLSKLKLDQYVAQMKIDKFENDFLENANKLNNLSKIVCDKLYTGTNITIGDSTFKAKNTNTNCVIGLKSDGSVDYIMDREVIS